MMVDFRVAFKFYMILLNYQVLHRTLALQPNEVVVQHSLKENPGHFDLNKLPEPEIHHESVNSHQMSRQGGSEQRIYQSSTPPCEVNPPQEIIISRPNLLDDFQAQDKSSTSSLGTSDKLVLSPIQVPKLTHETELQVAIKETRMKLEKLIRCTPENERESLLQSSVKSLLDPQFLSRSRKSITDDRLGLEIIPKDNFGNEMGKKIRGFQTLVPIDVPAAASLFYANRLLLKMRETLKFDPAYNSDAWIIDPWKTETILPFVYFIMNCNPSYYVWERIQTVSISVFKTYYELYILGRTDYDKEDFTRFLVWHTEVMYHAARSSDITESASESDQPQYLIRTKASPISRMLVAILRTPEYETYTSSDFRGSRREHLKRYIQKSWKSDLEKHYPGKRDGLESSLWDEWISKSKEISQKSQKICWPSISTDLNGPEKNFPTLLIRTESELFKKSKESEQSEFFSSYSQEFKEMLRVIQNPIKPELRSSRGDQDMFHGLSYFLENYSHRNFQDGIIISKKEFTLSLLSEFLDQDPRSEKFSDFWSYFEKYKDLLINQKNSRGKSETIQTEFNHSTKKRRVFKNITKL